MTDTDARLTPTEREIVRLYAAGWQPSEIAARRGVKARTIHAIAYTARRKGAVFPKAEKGHPPRKVDYIEYARDARCGLGVRAIARKHGTSDAVVSRALKMLREAGALAPKPELGGLRPGALGKPQMTA